MAAEEKWYFTKKQLENSPSRKCDIDADKELSYRQQAANFIQDVGQRLQVTQLCINTAIVYMHRFYVFHSFTQFYRYSMAAAALFLAAKVEEQPRKLEHVIKVAHLCLHKESEGLQPAPDVKSEQYANLAHDLVFNENVLLQTLGFDVAIDHPHTHVVRCCHLVKASKDLAQTSYFLASNSLHLTTMCLQYKPTVVACFCIHLACKWSNWEIPTSSEGKLWFTYVDETVTLDLLDDLTKEFIVIYNKCPSRLKKKIMSMSANQGQPGNSSAQSAGQGGQSSHNPPVGGNVNFPMTNCTSPMTIESKKLPTPPVTKDGMMYQSKSHHGQPKPGTSHQHRPPHDANMAYNDHKEKKERERERQNMSSQGVHGGSGSGVPHHKQLSASELNKHAGSSANILNPNHKHNILPNSSSAPHNRNPHHRTSGNSSSMSMDPKLKMHQQQQYAATSGSHSRPPSSSGASGASSNSSNSGGSSGQLRPDGYQLHGLPANAQYSQYQRSMERDSMHRGGGAAGGNSGVGSESQQQQLAPPSSSTREQSYREQHRNSSREQAHRDYNRERSSQPYHNRESSVNALGKEQFSSVSGSSSSANNSSGELKDKLNPNNVNSDYGTNLDNYNAISRERQMGVAEQIQNSNTHKSVYSSSSSSVGVGAGLLGNSLPDITGGPKDINSSDKIRFDLNRPYKPDHAKMTNSVGGNGQLSNSSKADQRHRSSREVPPDLVNKSHAKSLTHNDINNKKPPPQSSSIPTTQHMSRSSSTASSSYMQQMAAVVNSNNIQQQKLNVKSPYTAPPLHDNKGLLTSNNSSPPPPERDDQTSRNGNSNLQTSSDDVLKRLISASDLDLHHSPQYQLQPPPQKHKSIFSPEKEIPKTPSSAGGNFKRTKTDRTPPTSSSNSSSNSSKRTVDIPVIPPAVSPFGSPPAFNPPTPNPKNRHRTSSSSSEPELMVVVNKLENIRGYENMVRDSKSGGIKLPKAIEEKEKKPSSYNQSNTKNNKDAKLGAHESTSISPTPITPAALNNGLETNPTLISNLLKESVQLNHLPGSMVDPIKKEAAIESTASVGGHGGENILVNAAAIPSQPHFVNVLDKNQAEHHKSEKKKKKDKHKHKDKNRDDKEKKKKHKDKDREKHKEKKIINNSTASELLPPPPLKITIPKDKITPTPPSFLPEPQTGLKIKIPKERIKPDTISTNSIGGSGGGSGSNCGSIGTIAPIGSGSLKIKISKIANKEKMVENIGEIANRKREREATVDSQTGAPPLKTSKASSSGYCSRSIPTDGSTSSSRQNGRHSYNNKQVTLGEGALVGGNGAGALQAQAQWSTQVKLAESKYHSKATGSNTKQPPT